MCELISACEFLASNTRMAEAPARSTGQCGTGNGGSTFPADPRPAFVERNPRFDFGAPVLLPSVQGRLLAGIPPFPARRCCRGTGAHRHPPAVFRGRVVFRSKADCTGSEVHPAHAATRRHRGHCRLRLRLLGHHRLGGDEQAGHRCCILQRCRTTLVGSRIPALIMSVNSPFCAS